MFYLFFNGTSKNVFVVTIVVYFYVYFPALEILKFQNKTKTTTQKHCSGGKNKLK